MSDVEKSLRLTFVSGTNRKIRTSATRFRKEKKPKAPCGVSAAIIRGKQIDSMDAQNMVVATPNDIPTSGEQVSSGNPNKGEQLGQKLTPV